LGFGVETGREKRAVLLASDRGAGVGASLFFLLLPAQPAACRLPHHYYFRFQPLHGRTSITGFNNSSGNKTPNYEYFQDRPENSA